MSIPWWLPTLIGAGGMVVGFLAHILLLHMQVLAARQTADDLLREARIRADMIKQQAQLTASDETLRRQREFDEETKLRREEIRRREERVNRHELNAERKVTLLDKKEERLENMERALVGRDEETSKRQAELADLVRKAKETLQRIGGLSPEQAREELIRELETEVGAEREAVLRRQQETICEQAEQQAREIVATAIQRYAADQTSEVTTSTVQLPSDDMKGRIIGREGRNIRALEAATGVDILIDETPEVVVISGFDPLRREVARVALEQLMADGRIHPARIEDIVASVREDLDETVRAAGEEALFDLGLHGIKPELVRTLGRLKFRYSHAQNVLRHSVEMGHLMGMMAAELGLDQELGKRIGLFHDIGKALDHKVEGGHALIGADFLRRCGESPLVVNAVASHHGDVGGTSLYATLASAADAITASRPGARSKTTEVYLNRLSKLEEIADSFQGVAKSFAIQAGRELRVLVNPSRIDDDESLQLARNISAKIQEDMEYPGQIKVTVIREKRCVEYAR